MTAPVDDARLVRLPGNRRPEFNARTDRGPVEDAYPLAHLQLLLKRPPERQRALDDYIVALHDRTSPQYHHWLTAAEFGARFAPAAADVAAVRTWLERHGFSVDTVYPSGVLIDFSGTAGAVRSAFHTQIHRLAIGSESHIANAEAPQIPAALAPVVAGVVSLNDFRPHPLRRPRAAYTLSSSTHPLAPADLATIYGLAPLFARGYAGQGQTIAVLEDTDVYSTADWATFRSTFGLATYTTGSLTQVHPAPPRGANNCADPGVVTRPAGVDGEAILDAEWASAAAPGATIEVAACADTATTFGGLIALENLLNGAAPPPLVSLSYGECEALAGATTNAAYASAYAQAVTEGVSVFVAAGDDGAAACDPQVKSASHGIGVSGFASTPYDVAVGGTDFLDTYTGTSATYWSAGNSATYGSALGYVPEIPWNDSCAGRLLARYAGYSATTGSGSFCASSIGANYLTTTAGSGGPSACASGSPTSSGVVGGSCAGTPKPAWQSGPGVPADGVRDLPDVALFSGDGVWGHYYVFCWSNTATGGKACSGAPSTWSGGGGTSFAAPILAGIQALIDQAAGGRQGNPNVVYYTLAASQNHAGTACNASSSAQAAGCVFYDVTAGDMTVDCTGTADCYLPSGNYGALAPGGSATTTAFAAAAGWDFATGLGSVNAANLLAYWGSADLGLSASGALTASGLLSYSLGVTDHGPQSASGVSVTTTLPAGASLVSGASSAGCSQNGQTVTCAVGNVAVGATVALTLVVQTSASGSVSLAFAVNSPSPSLDPADGQANIAVNVPAAASRGDDAPLPPWATVALALGLLLLATRRLAVSTRAPSA